MTIAFILGSSANDVIKDIVVSCSCIKLSGIVTTLILPPSCTFPYFLAIASAPRKLSSACETETVTTPTWKSSIVLLSSACCVLASLVGASFLPQAVNSNVKIAKILNKILLNLINPSS